MGSIRLGLSCLLLTCSLLLAGDGNSKDAVDKVMGLYEGRWATMMRTDLWKCVRLLSAKAIIG